MYLVLIPAVLLGSNFNTCADERASVRILFSNNSNGKLVDCNCRSNPFGGIAERADLIRSYREEHSEVLVLDSGGYFGLSNSEIKGNLILKLMDAMGYDAAGIGDQELYRGLENFLGPFGWYREKIINASIRSGEGDNVFTPFRVVTAHGIRIGITGLLSKETFKFFPDDKIDFVIEEPDSTLKRLIPVMKSSCDYIIVLSQMGVNEDKTVAAKWPEIDLIVGGHSQTLIKEPVIAGNSRIVQAGKGGGQIGEIILSFDKSKNAGSFSYNLLEVTNKYTILPDIKTLLDDAMKTQP
jgi:5'-nucleotidase / UDP-sugar diphosphatase